MQVNVKHFGAAQWPFTSFGCRTICSIQLMGLSIADGLIYDSDSQNPSLPSQFACVVLCWITTWKFTRNTLNTHHRRTHINGVHLKTCFVLCHPIPKTVSCIFPFIQLLLSFLSFMLIHSKTFISKRSVLLGASYKLSQTEKQTQINLNEAQN